MSISGEVTGAGGGRREEDGPRVLCVGHVCVDMINVCSHYPAEDAKVGTNTKNNSRVAHFPKEDTDQRCLDQRWQRGGNASNNSTVLALLGAKATYFGTMAESHEKRFLLEDFTKYGVDTSQVVVHEGCEAPSSCVILSEVSGSRTIIHSNKNLPELSVEDFARLDLSPYQWIHFEGRNVTAVTGMLQLIREYNKKQPAGQFITCSVEIEKARPELEVLIPLADVVFVSKDYAAYKGYSSMAQTLREVCKVAHPGATLVCPWGEEGASACRGQGKVVHSPAFSPAKVVDTLGAGDTFNAATIFALAQGHDLQDSITFGCQVAGAKVGVVGWEPLSGLLGAGGVELPPRPKPSVAT